MDTRGQGQPRNVCRAGATRDPVANAFGVVLVVRVGFNVDQVATKDVIVDTTLEFRREFQERRGRCICCGTAHCQLCPSQRSDLRLHSLLWHQGSVEVQQSGRPIRIGLYANWCHRITVLWRLFLPARAVGGDVGVCGQEDRGAEASYLHWCLFPCDHMLNVLTRRLFHRGHGLGDCAASTK